MTSLNTISDSNKLFKNSELSNRYRVIASVRQSHDRSVHETKDSDYSKLSSL